MYDGRGRRPRAAPELEGTGFTSHVELAGWLSWLEWIDDADRDPNAFVWLGPLGWVRGMPCSAAPTVKQSPTEPISDDDIEELLGELGYKTVRDA